MRFGYWMPIFGGWLRNVNDEGMSIAWPYIRDLAVASEQQGFELSLIAELNLNDIKGHRAPSLDCWALAPAVAAVTSKLELMLAVRPNYHSPSLTAKALSTLDTIAPGRLSLNVVSSWWKDEAAQYGAPFDVHDARYARTEEWLDVVSRLLREQTMTHHGALYQLDGAVLEAGPPRIDIAAHVGNAPRAVVEMRAQRSATPLARRERRLDSRSVQHAHRGGVDLRTHRRLHAAAKQGYLARMLTRGHTQRLPRLALRARRW